MVSHPFSCILLDQWFLLVHMQQGCYTLELDAIKLESQARELS